MTEQNQLYNHLIQDALSVSFVEKLQPKKFEESEFAYNRNLERKIYNSMSKENNKVMPHAILVSPPGQGHINPMMKIAKLLHHWGFHITFVNTESIHQRLLKSQVSLQGLSTFQFVAIPDGLSDSEDNDAVDMPAIVRAIENNLLAPFRELVMRLNDTATSNVPPITSIVSDGCMSFTLEVAEELNIPNVLLWTHGACGIMAYANFHQLVEKGFTPLKGIIFLLNHVSTFPVVIT